MVNAELQDLKMELLGWLHKFQVTNIQLQYVWREYDAMSCCDFNTLATMCEVEGVTSHQNDDQWMLPRANGNGEIHFQ